MEVIGVFLLLGVLTTVALAVIGASARRRDKLAKAFLSLARKHHGAYQRSGAYEQHVEFRRNGVVYRVAIERQGRWFWRRHRMVISISGWGSTGLQARIRQRRVRDLSLLRPSTVGSGSVGFNLTYLVRGEPRERVKQLLSTGVRARIDLLRYACSSKNFAISIEDDQFRVIRKGVLKPVNKINDWCDAAIWLCDEMIGVLSVGIELSKPAELRVEDASCKICGEELDIDIVFCRRCDTPHHRDCWVFNGECSTYACGERRFRKVSPSSLQST